MYHLHILGNGAIGSLLAAGANRNGLDYSMYPRNVRQCSLNVTWIDGEQVRLTNCNAAPKFLTENDILVLPLKVYQLRDAFAAWKPYLSSSTPVVLLHNGMGGLEQARDILGDTHPVILATTSHGAYKADSSSVVYTGIGSTMMGLAPHLRKDSNYVALEKSIVELFELAFPPVQQVADIQTALWKKLAVNIAINPLTAINNCNNGHLLQTEFTETIEGLCDETSQVANAHGINLTKEALIALVRQVAKQTANNFSSMHQDVANKRRTEIDAINGYIVSLAGKKGIDVPLNTLMVEKVKKLVS